MQEGVAGAVAGVTAEEGSGTLAPPPRVCY